MLYVYCPRKSEGAFELVRSLGAQRLRQFDGMDFWNKRERFHLNEGDVIVCWGATIPPFDGIRVLNSMLEPMDKYREWYCIASGGLPTVTMYTEDQIGNYGKAKKLGLIARSKYHVGGNDLLTPPRFPDFYAQKLKTTNEFRVHSFCGRSIRAGVKVVREGFQLLDNEKDWKPNANLAHPWIRSFDAGWRVKYDGFVSTQVMRNLAHKAVKTLGLQFGAVDIAETAELAPNNLRILEVNKAPGVEGTSVDSYVKAIHRWIERGEEPEAREPAVNPFKPIQW